MFCDFERIFAELRTFITESRFKNNSWFCFLLINTFCISEYKNWKIPITVFNRLQLFLTVTQNPKKWSHVFTVSTSYVLSICYYREIRIFYLSVRVSIFVNGSCVLSICYRHLRVFFQDPSSSVSKYYKKDEISVSS